MKLNARILTHSRTDSIAITFPVLFPFLRFCKICLFMCFPNYEEKEAMVDSVGCVYFFLYFDFYLSSKFSKMVVWSFSYCALTSSMVILVLISLNICSGYLVLNLSEKIELCKIDGKSVS